MPEPESHASPRGPVLASEVLREELAPIEPSRRACRLWIGAAAAALVCLGLALRLGLGPGPSAGQNGATVAFSAGGALLAAAVLPFPYALRAGVTVLIGLVLAVLGLRGAGPLAGLGLGGELWPHAARLLAAAVLPASLLFRAHYRAFAGARWILALALILAAPYVLFEAQLLGSQGAPLLLRIAAAVALLTVFSAFGGFMGDVSTGGGSVVAVTVLTVAAAEVAVAAFLPGAWGTTGALVHAATGIGVLAATLLMSVGLFQLLAASLGPAARACARTTSPEDGSTD